MLFDVVVESKIRNNDDNIKIAASYILSCTEASCSILKVLFQSVFLNGELDNIYERFLKETPLERRDLKNLAIMDPAYEWSPDVEEAFWRSPLVLARSLRKLSWSFRQEDAFSVWLIERIMTVNHGTKPDKLMSWFSKTEWSWPLLKENNLSDYISFSLDRLAVVCSIYGSEKQNRIRLRVSPDLSKMISNSFASGTLFGGKIDQDKIINILQN